MKYEVLIVDDEEPARRKIAQFLEQEDRTYLPTFATNGQEALDALLKCNFDLLFLDIQMPQLNAFEMLNQIELDKCPPIIFSTAYDQYAMKAFEVHAIDYLLKPYDIKRFSMALNKVLVLVDNQKYPSALMEKLLEEWSPPKEKIEVIWVNQGGKLLPIAVNDIEYLESDGNYTQIHGNGRKYLLRESMARLYNKLNPQQFIRVHRSFIVNQLCIEELQPRSHGDLRATLKSGARVPVSRRYRQNLINR